MLMEYRFWRKKYCCSHQSSIFINRTFQQENQAQVCWQDISNQWEDNLKWYWAWIDYYFITITSVVIIANLISFSINLLLVDEKMRYFFVSYLWEINKCCCWQFSKSFEINQLWMKHFCFLLRLTLKNLF